MHLKYAFFRPIQQPPTPLWHPQTAVSLSSFHPKCALFLPFSPSYSSTSTTEYRRSYRQTHPRKEDSPRSSPINQTFPH